MRSRFPFIRVRGFPPLEKKDGQKGTAISRRSSVYFAVEGQAFTITADVTELGNTEVVIDMVPHTDRPGGRPVGIRENLYRGKHGPSADTSGTYSLLPEVNP